MPDQSKGSHSEITKLNPTSATTRTMLRQFFSQSFGMRRSMLTCSSSGSSAEPCQLRKSKKYSLCQAYFSLVLFRFGADHGGYKQSLRGPLATKPSCTSLDMGTRKTPCNSSSSFKTQATNKSKSSSAYAAFRHDPRFCACKLDTRQLSYRSAMPSLASAPPGPRCQPPEGSRPWSHVHQDGTDSDACN